jgi:hypothetical protein
MAAVRTCHGATPELFSQSQRTADMATLLSTDHFHIFIVPHKTSPVNSKFFPTVAYNKATHEKEVCV